MIRVIYQVDDPYLSRELVSKFLRARGYRVVTSARAEEALSLIREDPPDLVLMDIRFPGVDGLKAARTLKVDPHTHHIPVIAIKRAGRKRYWWVQAKVGIRCRTRRQQ